MAASFDVGRMGCATKVGCRRRLRSRVDFTSTREGSDVDIRTSSRLQINQPVTTTDTLSQQQDGDVEIYCHIYPSNSQKQTSLEGSNRQVLDNEHPWCQESDHQGDWITKRKSKNKWSPRFGKKSNSIKMMRLTGFAIAPGNENVGWFFIPRFTKGNLMISCRNSSFWSLIDLTNDS